MRSARALALAALLAVPAAEAYVGLCCGKCGGNMPLNIPGGGVPETYEFRLKLSPMRMRMEGLRDGTSSVAPSALLGMPAMGYYMAVPTAMDMDMLHLAVGYSASDDVMVGAMLMWKRNRMDMRFNGMMAASTGVPGFTMRSEGLGDVMLMLKRRLRADDPLMPTRQASLLLGLSLPTGSIDERNADHPVASRRDELLPYSMQLGSGTVDPTLGLLLQASRSPWWWGANLTWTARLYDNDRGWRLGDEARVDLYLMRQFRYDLVGELQLNARWQGRIRGEMDEVAAGTSGRATDGDPTSPYVSPAYDPDHHGGRTLYATLGLQWQPVPLQILNLQLTLPLYRDLNGPQLETDWQVMLTWYAEVPTRRSIRYRRRPPAPELGF